MTFSCWEGLAGAGAIEADRAVPHDLLEGGGLLEARLLQPQLVIGMDRAACPRRAIEGLRGQWQQRALLLGLEDEPGDLAGWCHARGCPPDPRHQTVARACMSARSRKCSPDVGDPRSTFGFPLAWRGAAGSTTKPRYCAYSRKTRAIVGA